MLKFIKMQYRLVAIECETKFNATYVKNKEIFYNMSPTYFASSLDGVVNNSADRPKVGSHYLS